MVRIADEIVDTYTGEDSLDQLNNMEQGIYTAINKGFSSNPVLNAFQITANNYSITEELIKPFFDSMRMDTKPQIFTNDKYSKYIEGSAEVIGLMCLKVFSSTKKQYNELEEGARALGAAFQKVNFLRDMASDYNLLQRFYFPEFSFRSFGEDDKYKIITNIEDDFNKAIPAIKKLQNGSGLAVFTAYNFYGLLLKKLSKTPASTIKSQRIRVSNMTKVAIILKSIPAYYVLKLRPANND